MLKYFCCILLQHEAKFYAISANIVFIKNCNEEFNEWLCFLNLEKRNAFCWWELPIHCLAFYHVFFVIMVNGFIIHKCICAYFNNVIFVEYFECDFVWMCWTRIINNVEYILRDFQSFTISLVCMHCIQGASKFHE